jgi:hypothetical protein
VNRVAGVGTVAIVIPLREDAADEVLALLRQGPPLNPRNGAVDVYRAFLSRREAILVFQGAGIDGGDGTPWEDLTRWSDADRWRRCAASAPRLANGVHSQWRPPDLDGIFFGPQPGPGDSEGGDTLERP